MTTSTHPAVLDDERITTFGLLIEANRRLMRTIEQSLRENHGLSIVDFECLLRLGRSPEHHMSMTELAGQMVLTSGGVTRLIDRLAGDGYVERIACPTDRRVQWASLTEAGLAKLTAALETHLGDLQDHFISEMSDEEMRVMAAVLDRLRSACR